MLNVSLELLGTVIYWVASAAILLLFARVILDWIVFFSPHWRPTGVILVIANAIHGVTDPPVRFLRQRIPPLRLGGIALDIGFMLLFVACLVMRNLGSFLIVAF